MNSEPQSQAPLEESVLPRPSRSRVGLGRIGRAILWPFSLFVLLVIAIIIAVGAYVAWREAGNVRVIQQQRAEWTGQLIESWFQEMHENLETAAHQAGLLDLAPEELESRLQEAFFRSTPYFQYITLIDARPERYGQEVIRVAGPYTFYDSGKSYADAAWFSAALTPGYHNSAVLYDHLGTPSIVMAQRIEEGDEVVGVIAAEADLSWVYDLLRQFFSRDRRNYVYIVNDEGQPILNEQVPFVKDPPARRDIGGIDAALEGHEFPFSYVGLNSEGEQVIGASQSLKKPPWFIIAEQPLPWVVEGLFPLVVATGGVFLLSVLAAVGVGLYISRRVARPIMHLREGARRIGAGELGYRITLRGRNELADLAEEFNRAAGQIQASQDQLEAWGQELETRVEERTVELRQAFKQLQQEAEVRENLLETIRQMSSPVIPILEDVLVMPVVGTIDSQRAQRVMEDVLAGIEQERARVIIIDITGLAVVDTAVANALLHTARAAQLLGAWSILVGISPSVAETLVHLGVELEDIQTAATLQEGLHLAVGLLERRGRPA